MISVRVTRSIVGPAVGHGGTLGHAWIVVGLWTRRRPVLAAVWEIRAPLWYGVDVGRSTTRSWSNSVVRTYNGLIIQCIHWYKVFENDIYELWRIWDMERFCFFTLAMFVPGVKSVPIALPSLGTCVYNVRLIATDVVGGCNGIYEIWRMSQVGILLV